MYDKIFEVSSEIHSYKLPTCVIKKPREDDEDFNLAFSVSLNPSALQTILSFQLCLVSVPDHIRPRVCSLPEKAYNPRLSDDLYRLRTFSITNKGGVVNCGDSIINRRSRSNTSVNSTASK